MNALIATTDQIATINSLLPETIQVFGMPRADGVLQLGADLLTDCGPGGTYEAAAEILRTLPVEPWQVYVPDL